MDAAWKTGAELRFPFKSNSKCSFLVTLYVQLANVSSPEAALLILNPGPAEDRGRNVPV